MSQQPIVRVVLGEAADPHPGPVRWALDLEGFDVVGQGSSRVELERVLAGVAPTVIVVDDAIPASAVIALRAKAPSAGVVVIWPAGVSSKAIADAHVDPGCIEEDLGRAVRRAARRATQAVYDPPVAVGEAVVILPDADPEPVAATIWSPSASAAPRRSARVLLGTAAVLALIVMMVGVSFARDATRRSGQSTGITTTDAPATPSTSTSSPAGPGPRAAGTAGHDRQDCGPRADSGSSASSHAATAHAGGNGDAGTRSHGANCGGAHAGVGSAGGRANAGGGVSGHGAGSTSATGAGKGNASAPTDKERGSGSGRQDQPEPDPSQTDHGGGSSNGRGSSDRPRRSAAHGSGTASHPTGG